ncbi:MAG: hypothetical protein ACOH5I_03360 [Oligoflexus sp.]
MSPEKPERSEEEETVTIPTAITGAYLFCQKISADIENDIQKVGCRVEDDAGKIENFKERIDSYTWSFEGSGVEISPNTMDVAQDWHQIFDIRANSNAPTTQTKFSVTFTIGDETSTLDIEVLLIWDEDCALPLISFENFLDLPNPSEVTIQDQFLESHGIRFSTLSGSPVLLAAYNQSDTLVYYGGPEKTANYLAPNQNAGSLFISDGHKITEETDTIVIEYNQPAKEVSMDIVDIDFYETVLLQAFDSQNQLVDQFHFYANGETLWDGQLMRFQVKSSTDLNEISRLHISGFNPSGLLGISFGIDNISPRCIQL